MGWFHKTEKISCPRCNEKVEYKAGATECTCASCGYTFRPAEEKIEKKQVGCPHCHAVIEFLPGTEEYKCEVCGHVFNPTAELARRKTLERTPEIAPVECHIAPDQLICKHPLNEFSSQATVVAQPGTTVLCIMGNECVLRVAGEKKSLAFLGQGEERLHMDIYAVRGRLNQKFLWGSQAAVTTPAQSFDFRIHGTAYVSKIIDPFKFLEWVGYQECRQADFEEDQPFYNQLHALLTGAIPSALAEAVEKNQYRPEELESYKDHAVRDEFEEQFNASLARAGLQVESVALESLAVSNVKIIDRLRYRAERTFDWGTANVRIHLKDKPAYWANVRFTGQGQLRLIDRSLVHAMDAVRWTDAAASDDVVRREIGEKTGRIFSSLLPQIVQGMMNDVNFPLGELGNYLSYLSNTLQDYLNTAGSPLNAQGLRVESMTVALGSMELSDVLAQYEKNIAQRSSVDLEEEMRRYLQNIEITRAEDESRLTIRQRELQNTLEADAAQHQLEKIERERKLDEAQRAVDEAREDHAAQRQAQKKAREYEEMYAQWQRQNKMEEEELQKLMERNRKKQTAQQELALDHAQYEDALKKIMRGIEESDLSWQEKLDAYNRLKRRNTDQDLLEHSRNAAAVNQDISLNQELNRLRISKEEKELAAAMARENADREETLRQAQFLRDMEKRKQEIALEMERLNKAREEQVAADAAAERIRAQQEEIEKLRLMIDFQLRQGEQQVSRDAAKTQVEALRQQAEAAYQHRQEQEARADKAREDALRQQANLKMSENAQALLNKMDATQRAIDSLRSECGLTASDQEQDASPIGQLKNAMLQIVNAIKAKTPAAAPVPPVSPVPPAVPYYAVPPVPAEKKCPYCGAINPPYSTACSGCHRPIF